VNEVWRRETARLRTSFDRIADFYRHQFADELDRKPFDRELLNRLASRFPRRSPVLEVGAGPAHIGAYLARWGVSAIASDASLGQLQQARGLDPTRSLVAADLARLPVRKGGLGGIVAFYCLIYGPPEQLDHILADWHSVLASGGLVVIAVHAGEGTQHIDEVQGRPVDITIVLRDPDDLVARLEASGFAIEELTVRPPYHDEHPTHRCYVVATRAAG